MSNYNAFLVENGGFSIDINKVISKTNARFTAKNALIAVLASGHTIAHLRYIIVENECTKVNKDMDNAPIFVKMIYNMTSKVYVNIIVFPVKLQYLVSTDDNLVYIFEGRGTKRDKISLVSTKPLTFAGK